MQCCAENMSAWTLFLIQAKCSTTSWLTAEWRRKRPEPSSDRSVKSHTLPHLSVSVCLYTNNICRYAFRFRHNILSYCPLFLFIFPLLCEPKLIGWPTSGQGKSLSRKLQSHCDLNEELCLYCNRCEHQTTSSSLWLDNWAQQNKVWTD